MSDRKHARPVIVLVDDDQPIREVYKIALREAGMDVRAASDATSAIQLVLRDHPAAVVCDMRMPGRSGLAVVEAAATLADRPAVIAFSAVPENSDIWGGRNLGWDYYIEKPASATELSDTIFEAIRANKKSRKGDRKRPTNAQVSGAPRPKRRQSI